MLRNQKTQSKERNVTEVRVEGPATLQLSLLTLLKAPPRRSVSAALTRTSVPLACYRGPLLKCGVHTAGTWGDSRWYEIAIVSHILKLLNQQSHTFLLDISLKIMNFKKYSKPATVQVKLQRGATCRGGPLIIAGAWEVSGSKHRAGRDGTLLCTTPFGHSASWQTPHLHPSALAFP